jgi:hypothetical protein
VQPAEAPGHNQKSHGEKAGTYRRSLAVVTIAFALTLQILDNGFGDTLMELKRLINP